MKNKGNQTHNNIIEKSLQIFSVKGYYNTSIKDILLATGLTKGGLYGHFQSKKDIWWAAFEEAILIWKGIVLKGTQNIIDPLERLEKTLENDMCVYIGGNVFNGGCFFLNMLVDFSGKSPKISRQILNGFEGFANLLESWLREAGQKEMLKPGLNYTEIANFIVISLNGAAALYSVNKDPKVWKQTLNQLRFYIRSFKK